MNSDRPEFLIMFAFTPERHRKILTLASISETKVSGP
jgi:hypothetical protein